jgi:hypothetical protein
VNYYPVTTVDSTDGTDNSNDARPAPQQALAAVYVRPVRFSSGDPQRRSRQTSGATKQIIIEVPRVPGRIALQQLTWLRRQPELIG